MLDERRRAADVACRRRASTRPSPGRAYAANGGIYIAASLVWLWLVEGQSPTRTDLAIAGAVVIVGFRGPVTLMPCRVSLRWAVPEIVPASSKNRASGANSSQMRSIGEVIEPR